jgi:hypothetical protein
MTCECAICALKLDFDLDAHLLNEIENGRCVIFAGAGISTETNGAHNSSFYDEIAHLSGVKDGRPFPELVDAFENQPNGRQKLIEQIKKRFDYIDGWRDLREAANRFHKSLATAPYFSTIVTTNWDRYFEDVIRATPFVYDSDLAFWDESDRPLLKIHGSIDNLSTIVASTTDYEDCEARLKTGRLGDILRHLFATKTVIFFGYSATDADFLSVFEAVRGSMGRFARVHYLVSPYLSDEEGLRLRSNLNIIGIRTDATHFIETAKAHMREKFCFAFDEVYDAIEMELMKISMEHMAFVGSYSVAAEPHLIFATAYQDGLIHCFQRIVDRRHTNDFADLHRVRGQADLYGERAEEYLSKRDYWNASYFIGYQMGLIYFDILNAGLDPKQEVAEELLELPYYYHPKLDVMKRDDYKERVRPHPEVHKSALKQALRFAKRYEGADDLVVQHTPFG